jgi:hypothetical protein
MSPPQNGQGSGSASASEARSVRQCEVWIEDLGCEAMGFIHTLCIDWLAGYRISARALRNCTSLKQIHHME